MLLVTTVLLLSVVKPCIPANNNMLCINPALVHALFIIKLMSIVAGFIITVAALMCLTVLMGCISASVLFAICVTSVWVMVQLVRGFVRAAKRPRVLTLGPKDTASALSGDADALPRATDALPVDTGALSGDTGVLSGDTGPLSGDTAALAGGD